MRARGNLCRVNMTSLMSVTACCQIASEIDNELLYRVTEEEKL